MRSKKLLTGILILMGTYGLSAQNVGIGTATPRTKLDVFGDIYLRGDDLYMSYDGATNANNDYMRYNDAVPNTLAGAGIFSFHADRTRAQAWTIPSASISAHGAFFTGRVGIGTSSPLTITHISAGNAGDAILRLEADTDNNNEDDNPRVEFYQDGGIVRAMMGFYDGANNNGNTFRIATYSGGVEHWDMFTIDLGAKNIGIGTSIASERLEITGGGIQLNGNYGIGFLGATPYPSNVTGDRYKMYYDVNYGGANLDFLIFEKTDGNALNPDGGIAFTTKGMNNIRRNALAIRGSKRLGLGTIINPAYALELPNSATIGVGRARSNAWVTYSDGRIKNNRKTLLYGLNTVMAIQPLEYLHHNSTHDKDGNIAISEESKKDIGFIAQDLQKIIPEIVYQPKEEQKDLWSVDYVRLVPVLTKAIQEQDLNIQKLEQQCSSLEQQLDALKNK